MPPTLHAEIERKLEAPPALEVPDLHQVEGVGALGPSATLHLAADYWDTAGLDLARHHAVLRRRTGGTDEGWHLKLEVGPPEADERAEHACPLGDGTTPPQSLVALVADVVADRPLRVVARVDTVRVETPLLGRDGLVLARFCDDHVVADAPAPGSQDESPVHADLPRPDPSRAGSSTWREWEVELADGDRSLLVAVSTALLAAGAQRPAFASKLAHALGDRLGTLPPPSTSGGRHRRHPSTTDVLRERLRTQLVALEAERDGVGTGDADAVHDMRVAIRRLRAALRTFEPVLRKGSTDHCAGELRWLGGVLGSARDAHVLRDRLTAELTALPRGGTAVDLGPVTARITAHLGLLDDVGQEAAAAVVTSERHQRLLDDLEALAAEPPARRRASSRATRLAPGLLARDARRLLRASRGVEAAAPAERDAALHETRKKAKQLRYGAESLAVVSRRTGRTVAAAATRVQTSLGEHQDAVVARDLLRAVGVQARAAGEDVTPYDALEQVEEAASAAALECYVDDLAHLRKVLRRRLGRDRMRAR